jgi:hypothetical protein
MQELFFDMAGWVKSLFLTNSAVAFQSLQIFGLNAYPGSTVSAIDFSLEEITRME